MYVAIVLLVGIQGQEARVCMSLSLVYILTVFYDFNISFYSLEFEELQVTDMKADNFPWPLALLCN